MEQEMVHGTSCLQPGWAHQSLLLQGGRKRSWLVVYTEKELAMSASAGRGTNQECHGAGGSSPLPVRRENGTTVPPRIQTADGELGQVPGEAYTFPASSSFLVDDPTATCAGSNSHPPPVVQQMLCLAEWSSGLTGVWGSEPIGVDGCHRGRS